MITLNKVHHTAIIASDYQKTKEFYTSILGLKIIKETYRKERKSYKLDLSLNKEYIIEIFSFENPPKRTTNPEAAGLRHLAFEVDNVELAIENLSSMNIFSEKIRIDEITGKAFTFIFDPDKLPIELYEK